MFCILKAGIFIKAQPILFEYRSYENFDANLFNDELRNVPWHIIENASNIDDALLTWNNCFLRLQILTHLSKGDVLKGHHFLG